MNQGRRLERTKETITARAVKECNCRQVAPGTVLLSFKLSIGKVGIAAVPLYTNEAIAALPIRPGVELDPVYLTWALRNTDLVAGVDRAAKGLTLNRDKLLRIELPVPPLPEQRRIAAVLDQAEALQTKRRLALSMLQNLRESLFRDLFCDPSALAWPERAVGSLATNIRTGPFGSQLLHSEFVDSGIAVLGIDNVVQNRFTWGQPRFITCEKFKELKRYEVQPKDVLVTIMGTCGRCAIVPDEIPRAINTKHLCCISLDQEQCLPSYLQACLLFHSGVLHQLGVRERGAVMPGLNMQIIKQLSIPLPPLHIQRTFEKQLQIAAQIERKQEAAHIRMAQLFASLQQRAFSGQL